MPAAPKGGTGAVPAAPLVAQDVDGAPAAACRSDNTIVDVLDYETTFAEVTPAFRLGVLAAHFGPRGSQRVVRRCFPAGSMNSMRLRATIDVRACPSPTLHHGAANSRVNGAGSPGV
jgi:hypothetical protein